MDNFIKIQDAQLTFEPLYIKNVTFDVTTQHNPPIYVYIRFTLYLVITTTRSLHVTTRLSTNQEANFMSHKKIFYFADFKFAYENCALKAVRRNLTWKCVIRCQGINFCYLKNIFFCVIWHVITRLTGQKAAPLLHLPGRRGRHFVTSVGTDKSTWRPSWGLPGFSHSVWVNAVYLSYATTFACSPFPMYYSSTIELSGSTREGWPVR
jgi:hypothetical protein